MTCAIKHENNIFEMHMRILGIEQLVEQQIIEIARRNHIKRLSVFGSRARGDYHRTSDIDLAVSGGNISKFMLEVDEETSTLLTFDVVNLDKGVQKELVESIDKEGVLIYEEI